MVSRHRSAARSGRCGLNEQHGGRISQHLPAGPELSLAGRPWPHRTVPGRGHPLETVDGHHFLRLAEEQLCGRRLPTLGQGG